MPIRKYENQRVFFKKSLGQNILTDKNIIKKIASLLQVASDDVILEIGPGLGALTDEIIKNGNEVIAIEKDTRFFDELTEKYADANISIFNEDALKFDYDILKKKYGGRVKVVANLPYNVSTEILFMLFDRMDCFRSFLLMFQKEVAVRITAKPSTKEYGIISVIAQYYSRPAMVLNVPNKCFVPVPKVESTVVYFDLYDTPPFLVKDEALFKYVVKTAFSHRRKTLLNCFKYFKHNKDTELDMNAIFSEADIDLKRRGETLSVEEFSRLSDTFYDHINTI